MGKTDTNTKLSVRRLLVGGTVCVVLALGGYGLLDQWDALVDLQRLLRDVMLDTTTLIALFGI